MADIGSEEGEEIEMIILFSLTSLITGLTLIIYSLRTNNPFKIDYELLGCALCAVGVIFMIYLCITQWIQITNRIF